MFCTDKGHSTFVPLDENVRAELQRAFKPEHAKYDFRRFNEHPLRLELLNGQSSDYYNNRYGEPTIAAYLGAIRDNLNEIAASSGDERFTVLANALGTSSFSKEALREVGVFVSEDAGFSLRDGQDYLELVPIEKVDCVKSEVSKYTGGHPYNEIYYTTPDAKAPAALTLANGPAILNEGGINTYATEELSLPSSRDTLDKVRRFAVANENSHLEFNRLYTGDPEAYRWEENVTYPSDFNRKSGPIFSRLEQYVAADELRSDAISIQADFDVVAEKLTRFLRNEYGDYSRSNPPPNIDYYHLSHRTIFNKVMETLGEDGNSYLDNFKVEVSQKYDVPFYDQVRQESIDRANELLAALSPAQKAGIVDFFREEERRITTHLLAVYYEPGKPGPT